MKKMFLAAAALAAVVMSCSKSDTDEAGNGNNGGNIPSIAGTYRMVKYEQELSDTVDINSATTNRISVSATRATGSNFSGEFVIDGSTIKTPTATSWRKTVTDLTTTDRNTGQVTTSRDSSGSSRGANFLTSAYRLEAGSKIYVEFGEWFMFMGLNEYDAERRFSYSVSGSDLTLESNYYRTMISPGQRTGNRVITKVVYRKQ